MRRHQAQLTRARAGLQSRRSAMKGAAALAGLAAVLALAPDAPAQGYPERPIRMVVAFPPGGAADFSARILNQHLAPALGQTIVVDNRGGAFGNIANDIVSKAAPDGYTLLVTADATITINPSVYSKLPYVAQRDLTPITLLITFANVLVLHPAVKASSVQELITLAKAQPGQMRYAHPGIGSLQQMSAEFFKLRTGTDFISVPFKGGGPAIVSLMSNETQLSFATPPSAIPHVKGGRLKAIAVTSAKRFGALPELPTISESGLPGFDVQGWIALFAPARTPRQIIDRLYKESARIMHLPDSKERVLAGGAEPGGMPPDEARELVRKETALWAKVVKTAGVKVE
jgi:tripartite-type tricarboxylate transporter receptor subunit TctC